MEKKKKVKKGVSDICRKMQLKDCFKVVPVLNFSLNKVLRKSEMTLQYTLGKMGGTKAIIHRKSMQRMVQFSVNSSFQPLKNMY